MTTKVQSTENTDEYLVGIKSNGEMDGIDERVSDIAVPVHDSNGSNNDDQDNHQDDIDDNDDNDNDDMIYNVNSTDSTVPVGITIAYKRYVAAADAEGRDVETMVPSSSKRNHHTVSGTWNNAEKRIKSTPPHSKYKRNLNNRKCSTGSSSSKYSKQLRDAKTSNWSVHKSLQVLLDSSLIYILCIIIPPILAYIYHNIIQEITWDTIKSIITNERTGINNTSGQASSYSHSAYSYDYHSFIDPWFVYLNEYQSYQYVKSAVYKPTIQYICTPITTYDTASTTSSSYNYYTSYLWTTVVEQMGICPPEYSRPQHRRSVISDDMSIYMDVFYVTICSFLLAIVRMMIVHYTIFKNSGNRVHDVASSDHPDNTIAMSNVDALTILVRCKSNHLLSSDYYIVTSTPDHSSHQRRVKEMSLDAVSQCMVTNLNEIHQHDTLITLNHHSTGMNENDANSSTIDTFGYNIDDSDRDVVVPPEHPPTDDMDNNSAFVRMNPLAVGIPASASFNHLPLSHANNNGDDDADDDADDKDMLTLSTPQQDDVIIQHVYKRDLELEDKEEEKRNQQRREREHRKLVYAAPRYATAIFRLLYCTITAGIALLYFRHADFWPWFVFGTGRGTKQCWDLSGGITVGGMDSDFDQHNAVLKRYFLWQASYHIHSSTFHFLLSMVFLFYPFVSSTAAVDTDTEIKPSSSKRLRGIKRGSHAYIRSFIQHLLSLLLIAVAYIFSSLRRLGAIGLFAFDVSSWSLHLLQICINAPDDSYLWTLLPTKYQNDRESCTRGLYLYVVVPSFVIARFMIWPALWYSAAYESQSWLQQLEMTLWPGSALLLRVIMHSLMLILHGISLLYLRRLLYHRLFSK